MGSIRCWIYARDRAVSQDGASDRARASLMPCVAITSTSSPTRHATAQYCAFMTVRAASSAERVSSDSCTNSTG